MTFHCRQVIDDARAYDVGLSDDAGGGNPLGSASRLKASPNQALASRVDDYIKWTLYGIKPDTAKAPFRALQVSAWRTGHASCVSTSHSCFSMS